MRRTEKLILIAALVFVAGSLLFSSCYYDSQEELFGITVCDTTSVSYEQDILPILQSNCLLCHSEATNVNQGGENNLEGFQNILGYVVAGDPENSLFYASVAWLTGAVPMPNPPGSSQLDDCELAMIRNWILQGASNN